MTDKRVFIFSNETSRQYAKAQCDIAPDGCKATFDYEPDKTRLQEEKYHAMITDISKCCKFMDREWSAEQWKRLLIDAFVKAMREEARAKGKDTPFPEYGELIPALDGHGWVQLGTQSRRFKKKIASEFIEYLYSWGSWNNVVWSEAAQWDERLMRAGDMEN